MDKIYFVAFSNFYKTWKIIYKATEWEQKSEVLLGELLGKFIGCRDALLLQFYSSLLHIKIYQYYETHLPPLNPVDHTEIKLVQFKKKQDQRQKRREVRIELVITPNKKFQYILVYRKLIM